MTGHQPILAMRRAGRKPEFVWVSDFADCTLDGLTVRISGDTPELEDFRFLVGVTALVEGSDPQRVERIAKACAPIAKRVIASVIQPVNEVRWETRRVTDTEEVMTWPN